MNEKLFANEYLTHVRPYKIASQAIWALPPREWNTVLKLDWNEAVTEPSPLVRKAVLDYVNSAEFFHLYPATLNAELLSLLAKFAGVPERCVQYFSSSDVLHEYIARLYVGGGDKVLLVWPSYDNFRSTAEACGGHIVYADVGEDFTFNPDSLRVAIRREKPKLAYICSPNNPVGYVVPSEQVRALLEENPDTVFVIDEAYAEFSRQTVNELALSHDNVLITHTLSKAFALANIRFGYLVSSVDNIDAISRIRNAKNVPSLTQIAAIAALKDVPYMWAYVDEVNRAKEWFIERLRSSELRDRLKVYPSSSNFVMIQCGDIETKSKIFYHLSERKIYIRQLTQSARLLDCMRITIGTKEQMKTVYEALREALRSADPRKGQSSENHHKEAPVMIDKNYCMSSYLTFRCIVKDGMEFAEGLRHAKDIVYPDDKKILVRTADDIAKAYKHLFEIKENDVKLGLMLSGGMDSACLGAFMKPGTDAYTFRFLGGEFRSEDMRRAEQFAAKYKLNLHYVDVNWDVCEKNVDALMEKKGAPVHPIEPQVMEAALQARQDGVEMMVAADGSDLVFGGMDKMLSKDWDYDEWIRFLTFLDPAEVLAEPVSMDHIFAPYKLPHNKIDYIKFMEEVFSHESNGVFCNAFATAGMKYLPYYDPSGMVKMAEPLDIQRVRRGESKYLIRELFRKCYPEFPIPEKVPMPRPVDYYFKDYKGPTRPEFKKGLDMSKFTGNQKWQMWCLERFLNKLDVKYKIAGGGVLRPLRRKRKEICRRIPVVMGAAA